ncbi:N-6 DNA methylase [Streptomyces griseus]|uniref:N-6 DNA methylase n=1 Tax=Streptomyces griseus TaxID=1911 RepID=UPI003649887C
MAGFFVSADSDVLTTPHAFRTILDPACGTAALSTKAAWCIEPMNLRADVTLYGQEINPDMRDLPCHHDDERPPGLDDHLRERLPQYRHQHLTVGPQQP